MFYLLTGGYDAFNHGTFHRVGKYFWDCDKKGVFIITAPHSSACKSSCSTEDYMKQEMNGRLTQSLSAVWSLRVRIVKTSGSSIPALGALAIWGYVAYSCPAPLARSVLSKWHNLNQPTTSSSSSTFLSTSSDVIDVQKSGESLGSATSVVNSTGSTHSGRALIEDDFEIPEEFLDGLTCDIMALPVRLPSGNVIDERTLERFANQEASWGRPLSDPFTAQPITGSRRPVYDTALKARIDSFLLKESHRPCLKNVPRTTGPIQTRSSDTLLHLADVSNTAVKRPSTSVPPAAAPPQPSIIDPSRRWLSNVGISLQHLTGSHSVRSKVPTSATPSSVTVVPIQSDTSATDCLCGVQDGRLVYSLPCSHRICRPCLLNSRVNNRLICGRCQSPFALHEPVLHHGR